MPAPLTDTMKSLYTLVGQRVRSVREDRDLTQRELAKAISMTRPSVTNIEGGRQKITLDILFRIAHELDVDVADLLPGMSEWSSSPEPRALPLPSDLRAGEISFITSIERSTGTRLARKK